MRKLHTVFHSGCTSLHSHQQCTRVPFLHIFTTNSWLVYLWCPFYHVRWYLIVVLFAFLWWLVTLNIFSYVYWPFLCPLWKSVYSGPLPIFNWIVCFFSVELYEFFIPLTRGIIGEHVFPFCGSSFYFVDDFLCCAKPF